MDDKSKTPVYKIGVTGTRSGMTNEQYFELRNFLNECDYRDLEFHHGDCIGVDEQAAKVAESVGARIVCHPPEKDELRAFFTSHEIREPKSYFARNRNIVDEVDLLIVIPYQETRQDRGGTWYTYDYAKKKDRKIMLITPKGVVTHE